MRNINWHQARFMELYFEPTGKIDFVQELLEKNELVLISLHNKDSIINILNHWKRGILIMRKRRKEVPQGILMIQHWRRSAAIAKRRGERGSPCLTPLLHLNSFPTVPFNQTEEVATPKISKTQCNHLSEKPLALSISRIRECSIKSKVFSKSNLRTTISLLE
jgi:hypothetical protein